MTVVLESQRRHYLADDESDILPREDTMPVGSTVLYPRTGVIKRWTGTAWIKTDEQVSYMDVMLAEILSELRTLRELAMLNRL